MLQIAQDYYELTEGEFDVTIGPLMDLWGFGRETQKCLQLLKYKRLWR